jgi:hypothetical protein
MLSDAGQEVIWGLGWVYWAVIESIDDGLELLTGNFNSGQLYVMDEL